ncbi:MAG TPA: O-antigen ligase family protein [Sphingomicrobium sp.]|nr:O-antigen ligase family protein [Sphingomicrobium sp.]
MKYILLLLWMGLCPIVASYLKSQPKYVQWAAFAMGLIPFVTGTLHLYVAPIAWPMWPGWPKGVEISAMDFLAIAILIGTKSQGRGLKQIWPWLAYLAAIFIAIPQGQVVLAGFFYAWQIMRVALVCAAAIRLASYAGAPESLLKGIFAGLIFQAGFAISQSAGGAAQAGGEFGSQNLLGLMAHFALFPAFALLLARKSAGWAFAAFAAAVVVDLLTASRATLGLAAIGLAILGVASIMKSATPRKFGIVGAGALLIAAVSPFAINAIQSRQSTNSVESSNNQRAAMESAAWMIIQDFPLGTGPDQYVVVSNMGGYSARAGVGWNASNRGTSVHNSYLLVWAETGLLGLITFLLVLITPIVGTFRTAFRFRKEAESELLLGFSVAMTIIALHLLYEWLWIMFVFQYTFAMTSGLAIGIAHRLTARAKQATRQSPSATEQRLPGGALPSAN